MARSASAIEGVNRTWKYGDSRKPAPTSLASADASSMTSATGTFFTSSDNA
jgi:hypothetical protein